MVESKTRIIEGPEISKKAQNPTVIILISIIDFGKSVVCPETDCVINSNSVMNGKSGISFNPSRGRELLDKILDLLETNLIANLDCIVGTTNLKCLTRKRLLKIADKYKARKKAFIVDIPFDIIVKRNLNKNNGIKVPYYVLVQNKSFYDNLMANSIHILKNEGFDEMTIIRPHLLHE